MTRTPQMTAVASACAQQVIANGGTSHGPVNVYMCAICELYLTTVDREAGVTPFMLRCKDHGDRECAGFMESKCYRVAQTLVPTHEWYRPDAIGDVPLILRDHVLKGGLVLRPIAAGSTIKAQTMHRETLAKLDEAVGDDVAALMRMVTGQLGIVFVNRAGGSVDVPTAELDGTGGWTLSIQVVDGATLQLITQRKQ